MEGHEDAAVARKAAEHSDGLDDDFFDQGITIAIKEVVGNMSISPGNRDLVLAARKGLFIVDLEHPRETPRFLPQGGTWEVADVQWNPHPSSSELIVSTSSQKLLIWNLKLRGQSSVQHILHGHFRAITDINWHGHFENIVASCSIDSWIWIWDLRENAKKNVMGMCAWNDAATQVKWNRRNPHILASSHRGCVHIWDDRKGALPLATIRAHDAKVYGIDWSRTTPNEIVTCSLDKTIKRWDLNSLGPPPDGTCHSRLSTPIAEIQTSYPVWRARHLPFGNGVLSLPQRGSNILEMYNLDHLEHPIADFTRTGLVKEYVWRVKGGADLSFDDREFQLVTLANDRTVKLESITPAIQESAGFVRGASIKVHMPRHGAPNITYRTLPDGPDTDNEKDSSGGRQELPRGGTRLLATPAQHRSLSISPVSGAILSSEVKGSSAPAPTVSMTLPPHRGRPRRRGMDQIAWFSSVKVDREKSAAPYGGDSNVPSRVPSKVRAASSTVNRTRSKSHSQDSFRVDADIPQDLADEVSIVVKKLAGKVQHEKTDTSKRKMMCTFTLYGPWGENGSTFLRVTFFNFPKDYPRALSPNSKPSVEIEKGTSIPLKTRAILLRNLRKILGSQGPALELCLLFLLGQYKRPSLPDSDSDDEIAASAQGDYPTPVLLNHQSLPRARHTQGVFGPGGQLVCLFQSNPPKIVASRGADSPTRSLVSFQPDGQRSSGGTLIDAMWGLSRLATDGPFISRDYVEPGRKRRSNFTDALVMKPAQRSRTRDSRPSHPRSVLIIKDFRHVDVLDGSLGADYVVSAQDPAAFCSRNAEVAAMHRRSDHARVWGMLHDLLLHVIPKSGQNSMSSFDSSSGSPVSSAPPILRKDFRTMFHIIYNEYSIQKDLQMLAMLSVLLLSVDALTPQRAPRVSLATAPPSATPTLRLSIDYFSLRIPNPGVHTPAVVQLPAPRLPSVPASSPASSGPSLSSSKASWFSSYRILGGGSDGSSPNTKRIPSEPTRPNVDNLHGPSSPSSVVTSAMTELRRRRSVVPSAHGAGASDVQTISKSRADSFPVRINTTPAAQGYRRRLPSLSQHVPPKKITTSKRATVSVTLHTPHATEPPLVDTQIRLRCEAHIRAYADILWRWNLLILRTELLKNSRVWDADREPILTIASLCRVCGKTAHTGKDMCAVSKSRNVSLQPSCTLCRLPVQNLGRSCLRCLHVTHVGCWQELHHKLKGRCASGCGCLCTSVEGRFEMDASANPQPVTVPPSPVEVTVLPSRWQSIEPRSRRHVHVS